MGPSEITITDTAENEANRPRTVLLNSPLKLVEAITILWVGRDQTLLIDYGQKRRGVAIGVPETLVISKR